MDRGRAHKADTRVRPTSGLQTRINSLGAQKRSFRIQKPSPIRIGCRLQSDRYRVITFEPSDRQVRNCVCKGPHEFETLRGTVDCFITNPLKIVLHSLLGCISISNVFKDSTSVAGLRPHNARAKANRRAGLPERFADRLAE